jgi:hypothetical protein
MGYCICAGNGDTFNGDYATREEAIASAPREHDLAPGDRFKTGRSRKLTLPCVDGGSVIEQAVCELVDECGDAAEDAIDATREQERDLGEMLSATFAAWAEKHGIVINCYAVDGIEEHEVPRD